jgi:hypothetical protein
VLAQALGINRTSDEPQIAGHGPRQAAPGEQSAGIGQVSLAVRRAARKLPVVTVGRWPGRAKAESKSAALNQSSKTGQQGKL